jgi:lipopolysaccharide export system permease protein
MILLLNKLFDIADLIIKKSVPLNEVLKLITFSLPFMIALTIPMGVLIASISLFGRYAQDFEIMGYASCGISLFRVSRSPLFFSIFLFIAMIFFDSYIVPESNHKLKNILFDIYQKRPAMSLKTGIFNEIENYRIYIGEKEDRFSLLKDIKINEKKEDGYRIIVAEKGQMSSQKDEFIYLILDNGFVQEIGKDKEILRELKFEKYVVKIPIEKEKVKEIRISRSDREMNINMILKEIKKLKKLLKKEKYNKYIKLQMNRFEVELHKKFAIPFASIVFILIGIGIAKKFGKGGYGSAFGISLFIFTFYYICLVGGEELADAGKLNPFISIWFPNIISLISGIILMKKMN